MPVQTRSDAELLAWLENLYRWYNHREFIQPDPLQFVHDYEDPRDQEVVGLIAASLAFGTVSQILRSVARVLERMPQPAQFVREATNRDLRAMFAGFRHRFVDGENLCNLLAGMKQAMQSYGSLRACFAAGLEEGHADVLPALTRFVTALRAPYPTSKNFLLSSPADGSACKRMHLYLRWMMRHDEVDPGAWAPMPTSTLIVPLDTHMHRIALDLGLTHRNQANHHTAIEITNAFRRLVPQDPVRYDFALTRPGIRKEPLTRSTEGPTFR